MRDLRVVSAKALLPVNSVGPIRGFLPPSVILTGGELYKTTEIEYNGVLASEFIVSDRNRLIVRIPPSQVGRELVSIRALAPISITKTDALVRLGLTTPIQSIQGVERLVQAWVTLFLTTPGSDIFDQKGGGGGAAIVGKVTDRAHRSAASDVAMAVQKTNADLMKKQATSRNVPLDEQLLSGTLGSVDFDPNSSTLRASVTLMNMAGDAATVALR